MKKLLFGFVVMLMMSSVCFGQTVTTETSKNLASSQMVSIVNAAKSFYVKGQTYEGFLQAMLIPSPTVPSQDAFFKKVYGYVSNNIADCEILKSDNTILYTYAIDLSKSSKNQGTSADLFGKKAWWQNLIEAVANVVLDVAVPNNQITIVIWEP